jgi:hypothetical protein
MHIEFLVEELSVEEALTHILPKILGAGVTFDIHSYQGKDDLLGKLLSRLKGYRSWIPEDWKIVTLVDVDDDNCQALKTKLEEQAIQAGFITKSSVKAGMNFQVLNRIVIEEIEAWYFGDVAAIHAAYPRFSLNVANKAAYRDPDAINGGTWEALERELKKAGYYSNGLAKITVANDISVNMQPERNRSKSFQVFRQGLLDLIGNLTVGGIGS